MQDRALIFGHLRQDELSADHALQVGCDCLVDVCDCADLNRMDAQASPELSVDPASHFSGTDPQGGGIEMGTLRHRWALLRFGGPSERGCFPERADNSAASPAGIKRPPGSRRIRIFPLENFPKFPRSCHLFINGGRKSTSLHFLFINPG